MLKKIVLKILAIETKLVLGKLKPSIIAITGSVGKTSTKEAVNAVLKPHYRVVASPKSYNSDIGIVLAVLGLTTAWRSVFGWVRNIVVGAVRVMRRGAGPQMIIMEMGISRPGDMDRSIGIVKPDIAVVTALGEIPVHVEFFSGPEALAREKTKLIKSLNAKGWAILNFDDDIVYEMREHSKAQILTYGFVAGSDVRATGYSIVTHTSHGKLIPYGITFKLEHKGKSVPVRIAGVFGKQYVYAALAAASVGIVHDLNLIEISEALSSLTPQPGRLRLLNGIKNTRIIDDSYNSSPLAVEAAFDVFCELPGKRKIAALGDMLELGKYTSDAHRQVGRRAGKVCDTIITVGIRAKFIAEEALELGHNDVHTFSNSEEAGKYVQDILQEGDLLLVKGSQSMRMEKIVKEVMANPEEADQFLVRQESYWKCR